MAKEKLLRFLMFGVVVLILCATVVTVSCQANTSLEITAEDKDWASSVAAQAKELTINNIMEKFKELKTSQDQKWEFEHTTNPPAALRIFVSQSMTKANLQHYHTQAVKYGGTLVFNGLPSGSFKKMTKLVMDISEEGEVGAMQIDDEAFKRFGVSTVPTIVLSREKGCWSGQSCQVIFDKIVGNVGIEYALQQFADNGELAKEALEMLKQ